MAFIDADTTLLADDITLPLLWAGLLVNAFGVFTTLHASVIGAAAPYVLLWVVFWGFKLLTGKDGMGYGDFKLLAALGAWLGWPSAPGDHPAVCGCRGLDGRRGHHLLRP